MPSYVTAKKNTEFVFWIGLPSQADPNIFQSSPTIAAGDFKVSVDGGALANPATLPTVTPAAGKLVKITLSAAEMNGDNIMLIASDAAGAQWQDVVVNIQTTAQQIDDLAPTSKFTTTLADSVAADGSRPSIEQALLMLTRFLMERSVVGTTMTVSKEDGSTPSMTFTLNDADNPTSISRAS